MGLLVCFSGRIGSGKTSVSEAVATQLGWGRYGFGDYLRSELARRGGDPCSREALQDLGQALVTADAHAFCRAVLDKGRFHPGSNFIIDGVRHVEIQAVTAKLAAPSVTKLVFLAADDTNRFKRVAERATGQAHFTRADAHKIEIELLNRLPAMADLSVDANNSFETVVESCLRAIKAWTDHEKR
jgi:dephospho-CoA kinase